MQLNESNHPVTKKIADKSSFGRVDELTVLLEATRERNFGLGEIRLLMSKTLEGYNQMVADLASAYRCGSLALANMAKKDGRSRASDCSVSFKRIAGRRIFRQTTALLGPFPKHESKRHLSGESSVTSLFLQSCTGSRNIMQRSSTRSGLITLLLIPTLVVRDVSIERHSMRKQAESSSFRPSFSEGVTLK